MVVDSKNQRLLLFYPQTLNSKKPNKNCVVSLVNIFQGIAALILIFIQKNV
jgi:hypothetical protein